MQAIRQARSDMHVVTCFIDKEPSLKNKAVRGGVQGSTAPCYSDVARRKKSVLRMIYPLTMAVVCSVERERAYLHLDVAEDGSVT